MLKKVRKTIRCKIILLIFFAWFHLLISTPIVNATSPYPIPADDSNFKVLVVYTTSQGHIDENVRQLDLLLGHFVSNVRFVNDREVNKSDLQGVTHLFYYGVSKQKVNPNFIQLVNTYKGDLIALGHNIKQFKNRFSFMEVRDHIWVNQFSMNDQHDKGYLDQRLPIYQIVNYNEKTEVLIKAWKGERHFPLFIQNNDTYYYGSDTLSSTFATYFGESLYQVFDQQSDKNHLTYLRLEDVHPLSDPKLLMEIGKYLWEKRISYVIVVIPVYVNSNNEQTTHFRENQEIVDTLRYMQRHGGNIILHGYTHKYQNKETGEGFEFWDTENDRPIYDHADQNRTIKQRHDFHSAKEYHDYIQNLKEFEEDYIRDRIEKGVRELVDVDLYPLAFEAPHYTMSQEGYKIASEYFNGLFGQVQLSNSTWKNMGAPPYLTKPDMLHGMLLYPETIGYYDPNALTPYQDIKENVERIKKTRNGMIGFFYHPYLGLEHLKPIIEELEQIPNLQWIDLKQHNLKVSTPHLEITTGDGESVNVVDSLSAKQKFWQHLSLGTFELVLWGVVCVVTIMVVTFFAYTISLRVRLRKSLFEERDVSNG